MDHSIIKSLLRKDFYEQNQTRLKASLFEDEVRDLYNVITEAHDRYDHDLCSNELNLLYEQQHPVATRSEKEVIADLIERISQSPDVSNEVASDILLDLYRKTEGLKIANYGISISEGRFEALEEVKNLISKIDEDFEPDDLPQPCRLTIDELMAYENLGFAKACNLGATFANSKWILFLNPDSLLENTLRSAKLFRCQNLYLIHFVLLGKNYKLHSLCLCMRRLVYMRQQRHYHKAIVCIHYCTKSIHQPDRPDTSAVFHQPYNKDCPACLNTLQQYTLNNDRTKAQN